MNILFAERFIYVYYKILHSNTRLRFMEILTLRVDKEFAQEIEKAMRPYYSTKTEFVRDAIRDKLKKIRLEEQKLRIWFIADACLHKQGQT